MRLFRIRLLHVETINWNGRYANIQPLRFTWWRSRLRWLRATVSIDRNRRIDLRRRRMLPTEHNEQICPLCGYLPVPSITSIGGVQFDFFRLSICPHRGRQNLRRTPPSEWDDGRNDTGQTQLTDKMSVSEIHAATTKESTFENMKMTVEMKKVRRSKKKLEGEQQQHNMPRRETVLLRVLPPLPCFLSLSISLSLFLFLLRPYFSSSGLFPFSRLAAAAAASAADGSSASWARRWDRWTAVAHRCTKKKQQQQQH